MIESALIVLHLPPKALKPNSRPHYRVKAKATKAYRNAAWALTLAECIETGPWEKVTVQATFFHAVRRRRDDVNHLAALKAAYDGIVDAGLLVDDDSEHLTTLPAVFEIDKENPRVELRVERVVG